MNNNYGNDYGAGSTASKNESKVGKRGDDSHGVDLRKYLDEAKSMGRSLESQMTTRPYVSLGVVAGVSFLAGSLLGSRIGQLAVAIGIGYAATHFLQGEDIKSIAKKVSE